MSKILQITDMHILPETGDRLLGVDTTSSFEQVLSHAHRRHASFDLILLTGDLAQNPCVESYRRMRDILKRYAAPSLCLPGNHDDFALMSAELDGEAISCSRTLMLGDWRIIALNSQKPRSPIGYLAESELVFLREELQKHPARPTLIALHHHCISSGSSWMDTMMVENSEALLKIIEAHRQVKAIVCGHVHQVLEKQRGDITLFGTPASCFQFLPGCDDFALDDRPPGYRVLELNADGSIRTEVEWLPNLADGLDFASNGY